MRGKEKALQNFGNVVTVYCNRSPTTDAGDRELRSRSARRFPKKNGKFTERKQEMFGFKSYPVVVKLPWHCFALHISKNAIRSTGGCIFLVAARGAVL